MNGIGSQRQTVPKPPPSPMSGFPTRKPNSLQRLYREDDVVWRGYDPSNSGCNKANGNKQHSYSFSLSKEKKRRTSRIYNPPLSKKSISSIIKYFFFF
jgi:hypothetical protein